jgi:hypothetical protein
MGCFPNDSIVKTPKGEKRCCELEINDMVLVDGGKYERIVWFSQFDTQTESSFVQITLRNGKRVRATGSHLIMVNNKMIKSFDQIVEGDKLSYKHKSRSVIHLETVVDKGLISPVTASGNIVVDNVLCTCYASWSAMKILTPIVNVLAVADINVSNKLVKRYNAMMFS